jgi:hypothetical protein
MDEMPNAGEVASFGELHERLSRYGEGWIFRGHSDVSWKLVPKAGRAPYLGHEVPLFRSWKRLAVEHLTSQLSSTWDLLAIAQHHGLATRLLDWTTNPLNAAYFSVRESREGPAVIHAARFADLFFKKPAEQSFPNPLEFDEGILVFCPRSVVPRIVRQNGLFTVHGPPDMSLDSFDPDVVTRESIVVSASYRPKLLVELARYGISSASLFPDLDGLSRYLNWTVESGSFLD